MHYLHIDLETFSELDIKQVALYNYAENCQILLCAFAFDDQPVDIIDLASGENFLAGLDEIGKVLNLSSDFQKISEGKKRINFFSSPGKSKADNQMSLFDSNSLNRLWNKKIRLRGKYILKSKKPCGKIAVMTNNQPQELSRYYFSKLAVKCQRKD